MTLAWIVLIFVVLFAFIDIKKTIIIWMPVQLLFNSQIAIRYESPGISLVIAANFLLIILYFLKISRKKYIINNEPFLLEQVFFASVITLSFSLLLSMVFSFRGVVEMVKYFATNFMLLAIFQKMIATKSDIRLFVKATFVVALLITSLGLFESVFKDNPILNYVYFNSPQNEITRGRMFYTPPSAGTGLSTRFGMVRAFSFFGIHIRFGIACAFILFFYIVLLQKKWFVIKQPYLIFISLMLLAGSLVANSKTAYLGILFFAFGLFSLKQLTNWKVIIPLIAVAIIVVGYFPQYLLNFTSLFDENIAEEGGGSTVALRMEQFRVARDMFMLNPLLGNGLGSVEALKTSAHFSRILGAESSWLEILPERGLAGAFIYIFMFFYIFSILKTSVPKKIIISFLLGVFVMEAATGLIDMTLYIPYLIVLRMMFRLEKLNKHRNRLVNHEQL